MLSSQAPELKYWQKEAAEKEAAVEGEGFSQAGSERRHEPAMSAEEKLHERRRETEVAPLCLCLPSKPAMGSCIDTPFLKRP